MLLGSCLIVGEIHLFDVRQDYFYVLMSESALIS